MAMIYVTDTVNKHTNLSLVPNVYRTVQYPDDFVLGLWKILANGVGVLTCT